MCQGALVLRAVIAILNCESIQGMRNGEASSRCTLLIINSCLLRIIGYSLPELFHDIFGCSLNLPAFPRLSGTDRRSYENTPHGGERHNEGSLPAQLIRFHV